MIEQWFTYRCEGCGKREDSNVGNPFNDDDLCKSCAKPKPMNQHDDYIALRDKFANDLRWIFPKSSLNISIEIGGLNSEDYNNFVEDAPEEGTKSSTRELFENFKYQVFELENGDEINTL